MRGGGGKKGNEGRIGPQLRHIYRRTKEAFSFLFSSPPPTTTEPLLQHSNHVPTTERGRRGKGRLVARSVAFWRWKRNVRGGKRWESERWRQKELNRDHRSTKGRERRKKEDIKILPHKNMAGGR